MTPPGEAPAEDLETITLDLGGMQSPAEASVSRGPGPVTEAYHNDKAHDHYGDYDESEDEEELPPPTAAQRAYALFRSVVFNDTPPLDFAGIQQEMGFQLLKLQLNFPLQMMQVKAELACPDRCAVLIVCLGRRPPPALRNPLFVYVHVHLYSSV